MINMNNTINKKGEKMQNLHWIYYNQYLQKFLKTFHNQKFSNMFGSNVMNLFGVKCVGKMNA